ncbi:MAG: OmpA family protein [Hyphomicrobium sp.]
MPSTKAILFAGASAAALALVVSPPRSFAEGDEPAMTPPGVTEYYGVSESAEKPAWAADATMNPEYAGATPTEPAAAEGASSEPTPSAASEDAAAAAKAAEAKRKADEEAAAKAAAEAEEAKKKAEEEAAAAAKAAEEAAAAKAAEEAEAKRKADEEAAKAAAEAEAKKKAEDEAAAAKAAEEAKRQQAIEACRDSLNAEALIGKLTFAIGQWDVLPKSYAALDKIAQVAKDCGDLVIEIGGHTDNQGNSESNVTISQLRAQSILRYLTRAGVDAAKLKAVGHGDSNPVADNATAEGRKKNRRVEFLVF